MEKIKYPRSYHLTYSEKLSSDDKKNSNEYHFDNKEVVVSLKMDGECTTIYNNFSHARSLDSKIDSEDRRWIESFREFKIKGNIPEEYRICGENLFYRHTCQYDDLEDMFYTFSIWDGDNCLSWEETINWCFLLGIKHVPVIYQGIYDKDLILKTFNDLKTDNTEGFVVRLSSSFNIDNFKYSLNKYVRSTFTIPSNHWRYSKKVLNKLKSGKNPWDFS